MAEELRAWQRRTSHPASLPDINSVAEEIKLLIAPADRAEARRQERLRYAKDALDRLGKAVQDVGVKLRESGLPIHKHLQGTNMIAQQLLRHWALQHEEYSESRYTVTGRHVVQPSRFLDGSPRSLYLFSGVGIRSTRDGEAFLCAGHLVGGDVDHPSPVWQEESRVLLASAAEGEAIAKLHAALLSSLPAALAEFRARLPTARR
ncbi:MAG: hypothetical protein M3198_13395 [Actinomycetota bacterium]|nr:hypothetical protein [Actinomycetota bacterium]